MTEKCTVLTKKFLQPCDGLLSLFNSPYSKGCGVRPVTLTDITTHKDTRSYAVIRSGDYKKRDALVSFCPSCGARIDEMWVV